MMRLHLVSISVNFNINTCQIFYKNFECGIESDTGGNTPHISSFSLDTVINKLEKISNHQLQSLLEKCPYSYSLHMLSKCG